MERSHGHHPVDRSRLCHRAEYQKALLDVQEYFAGSKISLTLAKHRARQRLFYYKCMQQLSKEQRHWTMLIDTDEYLAINYEVAQNLTQVDPTAQVLPPSKEGAVAQFVNRYATPKGSASTITTGQQRRKDDDNNPHPLYFLQSSPCIQIPRIRFGAQESPVDTIQKSVPEGLDGFNFVTLRYRIHTKPQDYKINKISKALVDLSRLDPSKDLMPVDSIHLPIRNWCDQRRLHLRKPQSLLTIHHYLGSYKHYTYRERDARMGEERSEAQWSKHNRISNPQTDDDEVRPWLDGFVESFKHSPQNLPSPHELLKDVGVLAPKSWTTYWGDSSKERCALCFFGLPRAFKTMVLPSIIQNVLIPNARNNCDVYVHFYQQYEEASGRKNRGGTLDPDQIYLLEKAVHDVQRNHGPPSDARTFREPTVAFTFDTEADFWKKRGDIVSKYQNATGKDGLPKYFPYRARTYQKSSIDNIVKQWHSIEYSFKLMDLTAKQLGVQYTRVAMLRSDVLYMTPLDVSLLDNGLTDTYNQFSVVPGFAAMPINDRMIYGNYEAVKVWATKRFSLVEERARLNPEPGYVMHSERFINGSVVPAMEASGFRTDWNYDLCFVRVRADESAMISDCQMGDLPTRGWGQVDKKALVESIVQRNCTRFKMGARWTFVGCGEGQEYHNGK